MKKIKKIDAEKIGDEIGINWAEINLDEFTVGVYVELEHGSKDPETNVTNNDNKMTGKIAWAHLKEFPDYYTRLEILEKEASIYWKKKERN